ncbi:hypothetical protein FQR65_LT08614 [Abscondita terminalis]|nr:hypothetical protein FQR65_LT08614 [Abscondita terminalis]
MLRTGRKNEIEIIYISRNPKDVCISSYYYLKDVMDVMDCTLEEYTKHFLKGETARQDHYWEHVLYFWERRNWPNVLFIKYEDMKNDLAQMIRKVATFLEKTLTEDEVLKLMKWLDFETMKNNAAVNHNNLYKKSGFIRSGKVGDHKKVMSDEVNKIFDFWIEENLKNTDYKL